jgi:hypothetical protein
MQHEFLLPDGAPQALLDGLPFYRANIHGCLEELKILAPIFFCLVHRGISILDQCFCIQAVFWIYTDANACGDMKIVVINRVRLRHRMKHSRCDDGNIDVNVVLVDGMSSYQRLHNVAGHNGGIF